MVVLILNHSVRFDSVRYGHGEKLERTTLHHS